MVHIIGILKGGILKNNLNDNLDQLNIEQKNDIMVDVEEVKEITNVDYHIKKEVVIIHNNIYMVAGIADVYLNNKDLDKDIESIEGG